MWLPYLSVIAESVSPVSSAAGDTVSYILGYGARGRRCRPAGAADHRVRQERRRAVDRSRADLVAENLRLIAEKTRASSSSAKGRIIAVPAIRMVS